jgi:cytochrome c oxidase subunit 4
MSSITDPTPLHATVTEPQTGYGHEHDPGDDSPVGDAHHSPYGMGHISSWQTLVKVWVALMVLTILTVMATWVNLGTLNIWIAMGIAFVKATLVVLYFMHMRHNKPFLAYLFTFSLAFVAFFLGMVMLDSKSYQPDIERRMLDDNQQTPIKQVIPAIVPSTPAAPTKTETPPAKTGH